MVSGIVVKTKPRTKGGNWAPTSENERLAREKKRNESRELRAGKQTCNSKEDTHSHETSDGKKRRGEGWCVCDCQDKWAGIPSGKGKAWPAKLGESTEVG